MRLDDSQMRVSAIATAGAIPAPAELVFIAAGDRRMRSRADSDRVGRRAAPMKHIGHRAVACVRIRTFVRRPIHHRKFCKGALAYHDVS